MDFVTIHFEDFKRFDSLVPIMPDTETIKSSKCRLFNFHQFILISLSIHFNSTKIFFSANANNFCGGESFSPHFRY